jgi:2-haloacid dehalogenase
MKFLTFDCYATLIDWKLGIEENFKTIFMKDGDKDDSRIYERYVVIEESIEENGYSTYREILKSASFRMAEDMGLRPQKAYAEKFASSIVKWPAFRDTISTLKSFGRLGYKRIILSNVDRDMLEGTIANNDLEVDGFITAEDIRSYKPQEKHWTAFLEKYHTNKEDVIHIANGMYSDIVPASRLGFRTIWVNRYKEDLPDDVKPSHVVDNLSEILNIL